jgi:hypothetical protein
METQSLSPFSAKPSFRSSKTPGLRTSRFCALNLETPLTSYSVNSSPHGSHTTATIDSHSQLTVTTLIWQNSCLSQVPMSDKIWRHESGSAPRQCVITESDNANLKRPSPTPASNSNERRSPYCIGRTVPQRPGRSEALVTSNRQISHTTKTSCQNNWPCESRQR